jgi:hypothetical protein
MLSISRRFREACGEPTTAVLTAPLALGVCALTVLISIILKDYVINVADSRAVFLFGSLILIAGYHVFHRVMLSGSPAYAAIPAKEKQFYVLSNLIKAAVLAALVPHSLLTLYEVVTYNRWDNTSIRNLGSLYAMTDLVSLILVRRMGRSTIIHHVCVVLFNIYSMMNDYTQPTVCRCVMVYAIFSSWAYLVNLLLATRFLGLSKGVTRALTAISFVIYSLSCAINWTWQVYYIAYLFQVNPHWSLFGYILCMISVVWDDLILNRWLCNNCTKPPIEEGSESKQK